jgi:hypothetical protein
VPPVLVVGAGQLLELIEDVLDGFERRIWVFPILFPIAMDTSNVASFGDVQMETVLAHDCRLARMSIYLKARLSQSLK